MSIEKSGILPHPSLISSMKQNVITKKKILWNPIVPEQDIDRYTNMAKSIYYGCLSAEKMHA